MHSRPKQRFERVTQAPELSCAENLCLRILLVKLGFFKIAASLAHKVGSKDPSAQPRRRFCGFRTKPERSAQKRQAFRASLSPQHRRTTNIDYLQSSAAPGRNPYILMHFLGALGISAPQFLHRTVARPPRFALASICIALTNSASPGMSPANI